MGAMRAVRYRRFSVSPRGCVYTRRVFGNDAIASHSCAAESNPRPSKPSFMPADGSRSGQRGSRPRSLSAAHCESNVSSPYSSLCVASFATASGSARHDDASAAASHWSFIAHVSAVARTPCGRRADARDGPVAPDASASAADTARSASASASAALTKSDDAPAAGAGAASTTGNEATEL